MKPQASLPHEPCHFFILQYGRSKESYQEYFYHPTGCDFPTFQEHVTAAVRDYAQRLAAGNQVQNRSISDFDLLIGAIAGLNAFGYQAIEPEQTWVVEDQFLEKDADPGKFHEWRIFQTTDSDQIYPVLLLIFSNGFYMDNLQIHLFKSPDKERTTTDDFAAVRQNGWTLTELTNRSTPTSRVYDAVYSAAEQEENAEDSIFDRLGDLGFEYLPSHDLFWPCSHRLAPEMEEILGREPYQALMQMNQERDADAPLHNPDRIQPNEDPFGDQEDSPF
jgi:hypothetical protein